MGDTILLRRGTAANLPDLQEGEPGFETDTFKLFIGTDAGTSGSAVQINSSYYDALNYSPYTFTQATIEAALTAIGTSDKVTLLLRPGTWVISSNADWSAYTNVTFKIVSGAVISHGAFTLNIPQLDTTGFHQRFNGTGVVTLGKADVLRPEFFGAPADQVSDDHVAVEKTVACAIASKIQTVRFDGKYYFTDYVEISTEGADLRFTGNAMAGWEDNPSKQSEITGINGLSTLFLFSADAYGLEIDHIRFRGNSVTTGVGSAIKSTAQTMPAKPINIHNSHFTGFAKAIYSHLDAALTYSGIYNVNIENNVFKTCTYALYGDGYAGAIGGLRFVGNVCKAGGCIKTEDDGLYGNFLISDNLLESNVNGIIIDASGAFGEISRNYFEGNTGYLVSFSASATSTLKMEGNYYNTVTGTKVKVYNAEFHNYDNFADNGIFLDVNLLSKGSFINQATMYAADNSVGTNYIGVRDIDKDSSPSTVTGTIVSPYISGNKTLTNTPLGTRLYQAVDTTYFSFAEALAVNDFVVGTFLVRKKANGAFYVQLRDDAETLLSTTEVSFGGGAVGEWFVFHFYIKLAATSTGHFHYNWQVGTTQLEVASGFMYVAKDVVSSVNVALPRMGGAGVATIANPATTVTVTHGLGYTPSFVTATPQGETMGSVFVSAIGATTFVINVSAAPAGTGYISWTAN